MANLAVANLSFHELRRGLILVMEDDVVEYFGDFEALLTRHAHFGSETWFRTHRVAILPKKLSREGPSASHFGQKQRLLLA